MFSNHSFFMKKLLSIFFLASALITYSPLLAQTTPLPYYLASKIHDNYFISGGYKFDISQVSTSDHLADILHQLELQVYFVNVLNLPQEIQDFFKSISVVIAPPTDTEEYKHGDYDNTTSKSITLQANELIKQDYWWSNYKLEDTAFLEALLMALLDQHFSQGIKNPDIVKYFNQAKSLPCYQKENLLWISNSSEDAIYFFFLSSAMSYLRGSFWDEPFSCYEIQKNQPEFFNFLENLFGPKSGFLHQCFSYHGFNFNWSEMDDFSNYQQICKECMRQVDYIESTGVPKNIMDFFKSVPIKLKCDYQMGSMALGEYVNYNRSIALNAHKSLFSFLNAGKPDVPLLHELLHAFHDQVLLDGFQNTYIIQFFKEAQQMHYYDHSTNNGFYLPYLMTNEREFFACTATAFLGNYTPDEPFNRTEICKHQPNYYLYLQGIFSTTHDDMGIVEKSLTSNAIDYLY